MSLSLLSEIRYDIIKVFLLFRGFYLKDVILKICYMSEVSASTIVFCYTEMHSKSSPYVYMHLLNEVDVTVLGITG